MKTFIALCVMLSLLDLVTGAHAVDSIPSPTAAKVPSWLIEGPPDEMLAWIKGPLRMACLQAPALAEVDCLGMLVRAHRAIREEGALAVGNPNRRDGEPAQRDLTMDVPGFFAASLLWTKVYLPHACYSAPTEAATRGCLDDAEKQYRQVTAALEEQSRKTTQAQERELQSKKRELNAQIEMYQQQLDAQRETARVQAAGQALMGLGMSGGLFKMPPPVQPMPTYQPAPMVIPKPLHCTTAAAAPLLYTNCY